MSVAVLSRVAVKYYEQRAQVIVFFKQETPEADILSFRDKIYDPTLIADIQYLSQEDALAIYKEDFADNPDYHHMFFSRTIQHLHLFVAEL